MRVRGEWNASTRQVEFEYATSRIRVRDEARVRRYLRAVPYVLTELLCTNRTIMNQQINGHIFYIYESQKLPTDNICSTLSTAILEHNLAHHCKLLSKLINCLQLFTLMYVGTTCKPINC